MSERISGPFRDEYIPQQNYAAPFPLSGKAASIKRNSETLPIYGQTTDYSITNLLNASAGHTIKNVIGELEKRRAKYFDLACAAEARAREAEEKREQAENRLKQETYQRLVAEQRLKEFEEDPNRQLKAVEIERTKTLEAERALGEAIDRLRKAETRIKDAENEASSLTLALTKAYQKKVEAEVIAREIEEKSQIIEALCLRSEGATDIAIVGNQIFGLQIFASRSKLRAIERAIRDVEARHRPQEDYLNNLLHEQPAKSRSLGNDSPFAEGAFTSLNSLNSVDDDHAYHETEQKGLGIKLKFFIYGMVTTLLVAWCWQLISAFLRN